MKPIKMLIVNCLIFLATQVCLVALDVQIPNVECLNKPLGTNQLLIGSPADIAPAKIELDLYKGTLMEIKFHFAAGVTMDIARQSINKTFSQIETKFPYGPLYLWKNADYNIVVTDDRDKHKSIFGRQLGSTNDYRVTISVSSFKPVPAAPKSVK